MTMIIGCKCGKYKIKSSEPDKEYGQYYLMVECENFGYHWEGYYGHL